MKISILTLFPKVVAEFVNHSIIKRAVENKHVEIEIINFRDFSKEKTKSVDCYQYGGGAGMVLTLQPIVDAIRSVKTSDSKVILTSAQGKTYTQHLAKKYSEYKHIIILCGHYEGFDERIVNYVDEIISIGDYVLTGGELPAMIITDSVVRLLNNVISENSLCSETFNDNLLDYSVYAKPLDFEGHKVPEVLLSGNHQKIADFRNESRIQKTKTNRKDLYKKHLKNKEEKHVNY